MIKYCQNCGERPSVITVNASIAGPNKYLCLCAICAKKLGLTNVQKSGDAYEQILFSSKSERKCPNCGTSESDFYETGYTGCSVCYYVFSDAAKMCEKWHGRSKHTGKISSSAVLSKTRLGTLMLRLRKASLEGNAEEIRQIKQEIQMLEANNAKK